MAQQHRYFTAQQWADLIKEQQTGVDSIDVFYTRKRLGASTFTKWRRRFQNGWERPSQAELEEPRGFVEVVSSSSSMVSLVLDDGVRLELPVAVRSEEIAEVRQTAKVWSTCRGSVPVLQYEKCREICQSTLRRKESHYHDTHG